MDSILALSLVLNMEYRREHEVLEKNSFIFNGFIYGGF